jgi:hypothetical protein
MEAKTMSKFIENLQKLFLINYIAINGKSKEKLG